MFGFDCVWYTLYLGLWLLRGMIVFVRLFACLRFGGLVMLFGCLLLVWVVWALW